MHEPHSGPWSEGQRCICRALPGGGYGRGEKACGEGLMLFLEAGMTCGREGVSGSYRTRTVVSFRVGRHAG